mgnify:FL=1
MAIIQIGVIETSADGTLVTIQTGEDTTETLVVA